jgi:predicted nucleotidyltransferase
MSNPSHETEALPTGAATPADFARASKIALDPETERAIRAFMQRIAGRYSVSEGILFGSRARHTHHAESDADIAVVLKGTHGNRTAAVVDMAGIAFDVLLETGVLVEALPLWEDEIQHPELFRNPALIQNIRRDGVRL